MRGSTEMDHAETMGGRGGNRRSLALWGAAATLLLLPLAAMQFTDEVEWDLADFVVFGAMLVGACGSYELATRVSRDRAYRAGAGVALAAAFILVWMNLAVGVIGSEDNPANWLFAGVLGVGGLGALVGRFRPGGMARAMIATALAQVLVALIAVIAGWGSIFPLTALFVAVWLVAARLFSRAARRRRPTG